MIKKQELTTYIENYLKEDIGDGDHSSRACIPDSIQGKAQLLVKEKGILAGIAIAELIFNIVDKNLLFSKKLDDGSSINLGDIAFTIEGNSQSILTAERLVLNCMQRMSGIATTTNQYVNLTKGTKAKVLDTRKTTPGFRLFEKLAVKIGGGENHRMGLYDMIMIKDNHIDYAGGIEAAINKVNNYLYEKDKNLPIEIEARNLTELDEILTVGKVNRIMLDNFSIVDTKTAVNLIRGKYEIESSGGITIDTIRSYAKCGVDFISVGALTHQIKSLDLSLKAVN